MYSPYLLLYLSFGWLSGIALASVAAQPPWVWLALAGLAAAALFGASGRWRIVFACAACLGLGGWRYQLALPKYDDRFIATHNDRGAVTLEGVVVDGPDVRDSHVNLRLSAQSIWLGSNDEPRAVHGLVLVQTPRFPVYGYGDRLRASGELKTPPEFEDFSYRDYLAREGVYSILRRANVTRLSERQGNPVTQALFDFKSKALETIARSYPEPQASLLQGILLGVESTIPQHLKDDFSTTGTSHIVAISGFNISILAGAFMALFSRLLGLRRGALVAVVGIMAYTFLVGADAAVVRAAIMGSLALFAKLIGRRGVGLITLAFTAAVMCAINPLVLWDVGFQLSFAATLGLVLYADPFQAAFARFLARFTAPENAERAAGLASEVFILTLAAQVTTLPIIVYYFRRLSLISLAANILVLPAQPPLMILGGIATIIGLALPAAASTAAWLAWPFLTYSIAVVELLARVPLGSIDVGRLSFATVAAMYALIFGATYLASRPAESRPKWWGALSSQWLANAALIALGFAVILGWGAVFVLPDGRLHVTILDVGQGEAVLIRTPSGAHALIGGGPSPGALAEALGRRMPFWDRKLALVVVATSSAEHIGGLAGVVPRYAVAQTLIVGNAGRSAAYRELREGLAERGVPVIRAETGQGFDFGDGVRLSVAAANDDGAALRLIWGGASFDFPIGAMPESPVGSTVWLVPRSGGTSALTAEQVEKVNPWAAVISVGAGNPAGDPAPETLTALKGRTVLRTDVDGWVSFATDGERLWAETGR